LEGKISELCAVIARKENCAEGMVESDVLAKYSLKAKS